MNRTPPLRFMQSGIASCECIGVGGVALAGEMLLHNVEMAKYVALGLP